MFTQHSALPPSLASRGLAGRAFVAVAVLLLAFGCSDQPSDPVSPAPLELPNVLAALTPTQVAKLVASDAAAADFFGSSVAVSGDAAVIGAYGDDDAGFSSGSAYVFRHTVAGVWSQEAKLTATDGASGDQFGEHVAVSGDVAVAGALADDDAGSLSGSAYVFRHAGSGVWAQEVKLLPLDLAAGDRFGAAVAVSGDVAVIGSRNDDDAGTNSGSAYVFRHTGGGVWIQEAKLTATDAAAGDIFGISVAVSGEVALVGAHADDDAGTNSGSAYVFRHAGGGTWIQEAKLTAIDAAAGDRFGEAVAVSGDVAVVGAGFDDDAGSEAGSAYIFRHTGGGVWTQEAKLAASDGAALDWFGRAVAVSGDLAVVGAQHGSGSGSAYVFLYSDGVWIQKGKLLAEDGVAGHLFGFAVAVSTDVALVSAFADNHAGSYSGSAYVFELGVEPSGEEAVIEDVIDDLVTLASGTGSTALAEEMQDAINRLDVALDELAQTPPDYVAAVKALEKAVDLLESAVDDGLLGPAEGAALMDELAGVARDIAVAAIDDAIARSGDLDRIDEAETELADGDTLRESGDFTDAVDKYKDALVSANRA